MAFSLMSFAFAVDTASDFTDYDSITYQEAVDVMTAIGVFNGYDDGTSFNPSGTLTREQGAKIITYMLLGQTAADKLTTTVAPFSDVPASKWSAGSIAYCSERGILAGDGTGKFNPEASLSGYAFAKMLLTALGYDADIQGYVGGSWAINVAADAVTAGIDITGVVLSNDVTREQAAQMSFQTLEADVVDYSNRGTNITTTDGTTVNVGASKPEAVSYGVTYTTTNGSNARDYTLNNTGDSKEGTQQFVEKYFSTLKKNENDSDSFNRPGTSWTLNNSSVNFTTDEAVATFNSKTSAADVASALAGYKVTFDNDNDSNPDTKSKTYSITNVNTLANTTVKGINAVYWNGNDTNVSELYRVDDDTVTNEAAAAPIEYSSAKTIAASIAAITGNGKLVEFYANSDNVITDIVAVTYRVTEVANIVSNSSRTIYTLDNTAYYDYVDPNVTDTVVLHGDVAIGDVVTYAVVGGKAHIYPTTQVTGSQSSSNLGSNQITVGGTVYPVGVNVYTGTSTKVSTSDFVNSTNEATYYLDQFGNVVKSTSSISSEYAYVLATTASVSGGLNAGVPSASVRLILEDGTIVDRTVELEKLTAGDTRITNSNGTLEAGNYVVKGTSLKVDNSGTDSDAADSVSQALLNKVCGYSLSDTSVTLSPVTEASTADGVANTVYSMDYTANTLVKNQNSYGEYGKTALMNNNTDFVIYNKDTGATSVYTGSANLPTAVNNTTMDDVKIVYKTSSPGTGSTNVTSGNALVVFATYSGTAITADASNYAYVDTANYVSTLSNGTTTYVYTGVLPDSTTVELSSTTLYQNAGIYTYTDNNVISAAVSTETNPSTSARYNYVTSFGGTDGYVIVTIDGVTNYYAITSDTLVVYVNENAGTVTNNGGFYVLEVSNGSTTNNVAAIYVTKVN
jgi:hypothetical protein